MFDRFAGYFMTGYMLLLTGMMIVLACVPDQALFLNRAPPIPTWQVRVGLLLVGGITLFGARLGVSWGAARQNQRQAELFEKMKKIVADTMGEIDAATAKIESALARDSEK